MIRILHSSPRSGLILDFPPAKLKQALKNRKNSIWIDFCEEPDAKCAQIMLDIFGFHHLAVDDALQETHIPKVDDWGEYLYIVLIALENPGPTALDPLPHTELDIFLGGNFLVTHHDRPIPCMDKVFEACRRDKRQIQGGSDHLLYKIIDCVVADYMPIVEVLDRNIDLLEDQIFKDPAPQILEDLFDIKRTLLAMRRMITPQREVLNKLARDDYRVIDPADRIFFRDIYDHLVRLHDLNESMRDLVGGTLDMYLSVVNNRLNEIMKTLTVITSVFMPISFIAGFFGMNFFPPGESLVHWTENPVFYITLVITFILPLSMFVWMRRRTWV